MSCAVAAVAVSCGGPQVRKPIPDSLKERCANVQAELVKRKADGKHVAMRLHWRAGEASEMIGEEELAERVLAAAGGMQTWVLARGGSGKSRIVDTVQGVACDRVATVRVDAAIDYRPKAEMATKDRPALASLVLAKAGAADTGDPADALQEAIGDQPWLVLIDGTDELTLAERRALERDLAWLGRQKVRQPHVVRFERPGFTDPNRGQPPVASVDLPELPTAVVNAALQKRFAKPEQWAAVQQWLAKLGLDRKMADHGGESYVHMATWRDTETVSDLADDALKGMEELPAAPNRADLYAAWLGHRLSLAAPTMDAAMRWLDRITALGVQDATEPDMLLTLDRCANASAPGAAPVAEACGALVKSPIVKGGPTTSSWIMKNQTLTDLLMARWLVNKYDDCNLLAAATADIASLELTAMVLSHVGGRRCITPIVAAVCSRGTPAEDIGKFVDEALPRDGEWNETVDRAKERSQSPCERQVFKSLRPMAVLEK